MAITAAALTSGSSVTDATSYATASITPTANLLILLLVYNRIGVAPPSVPTATGNGLTWVKITNIIGVTNGTNRCLTLFRAMGAAPSAGAITIDLGGVTHTACIWSVAEFAGIDTSGTNGSGAVVQSATQEGAASATSVTVTLAAFGDAGNGAYGGFQHNTNEVTSPGSGFTEIHDVAISENSTGLESEWIATNDTTVDCSWASATNTSSGVAIEIKAAAAASNVARLTRGGILLNGGILVGGALVN